MGFEKTVWVRKGLVPFFILCALTVVAGLPTVSTASNERPGKLTVYVVNYPLKYFAKRISGDHAEVVFPAPADEDPAYWMPDAKTILEYQRADIILLNGANYAKWVNKVTLPRFRLVDTSASFKDRYIEVPSVVTHTHGPTGKHAHEALAFTIWLDLELAARQAKAIVKALSRKKPALRDTFQGNYAYLEKELVALDMDIKAIVSKNLSKAFVASHPVYDYFQKRYGLNIKSVHWEPHEIPSDAQWAELQKMLKGHPATWMIWEGDPVTESVEELEALGVNSLVFDPCGNTPDKGDFMSVMRGNVENLRKAFP